MTTENENLETSTENDESTEATEESMLDVIGAAVDEVTPDDVLESNKPEAEETPEGDDAAETGDETPAAEETPEVEETPAAEETPEGDDASKTDDETPEGDDAAKTGDETPEGDAAAKTAATEEADPVNDPIAEGTNEKTASRIKSLINIAKENTQHAGERDELVTAITDTGADPGQYANTLGFLKLYNSKDAGQRQQALQVAEGIVRELQVELGVGTVNLLESHSDLKAEVEAGTLTQERAVELATGREQKTLADSRTEAANTVAAADQQTLNLIATGKEQLNVLESTLKTDPDYARLRPLFTGVLKPALREIHPSKWGEVAAVTFQQIKAANPAPAEISTPAPVNTPLRARSSGGGSSDKKGEPESALAAINSVLSEM